MFNCECYPNHDICKNLNLCEFWIPLNQKYESLLRELTYELDLLDIESKKSDIIQDINDELLKIQEEYVDKQIDLINKELDAKL